MIRILFVVFVCSLSLKLSGQQPGKASWAFGANPYYGGILRYKEGMKKIKWTNLHGLELYANKLTNGRHRWERQFNYQELGFALEYYNYGVPDELG